MADVRVRFARIRNGLTPAEWGRAGGMAATIVGLNVAGWVMLAAAVGGHYHVTSKEVFGFGTGILAYTLGMRHAFDADHIAAIDNTTRKLVQDGKRPLSVGFFFSLGHSSVVFMLAVLLNFGIRGLDKQVRKAAPYLNPATANVPRATRPSTVLGAKYNEGSKDIYQAISRILNGASAQSVLPGLQSQLQSLLR